MLIYLIIFLRQSVAIIGNFLHLGRLSQTSCETILIRNQRIYSCFWDERKWLTALAAFLFMVSLSIHGFFVSVYNICKFSNICYIFFSITVLSLLQSKWYIFYVNSRLICYIQFTDKPSFKRNKEVSCENCGRKLQRATLYDTRRVAPLDYFLHWMSQLIKNISGWPQLSHT